MHDRSGRPARQGRVVAPATRVVVTRGCLVAAGAVAVDQTTKIIGTSLGNTAFTHPVTNPDFSLGLAGGPVSVMVLLTVVGTVAFGAYVVAQSVRGRLPAWVPGVLVGGAVSNLADRVALGAVRDFVATPLVVWNLADLAVVIGIAGYAWGHLRRREPDDQAKGGESAHVHAS